VILDNGDRPDELMINAPNLAHLMEHCQSLKNLTLWNLALDENHCRELGVHSRPDLEINLKSCAITGSGARALVEVLEHNQGPTELDSCEIDYSVLADRLRGNSRLKSFRQDSFFFRDNYNRQVLAIANAVLETQGLVEFRRSHGAVCDSLKTHPTLEVVDITPTSVYAPVGPPPMAPDVITSRMQALLDM
jgi:hypothetical protein